jgi:hypothetical protein
MRKPPTYVKSGNNDDNNNKVYASNRTIYSNIMKDKIFSI